MSIAEVDTHLRSQFGQDHFIYQNFMGFRNGVFFEAGALDGEQISNTYLFEKALAWTGVLVEMQPKFAASLRSKRPNAKIFGCGLSTEAGKLMWMNAGDRSGLLRYLDHESIKYLEDHCKNIEPKPTYSLEWVEVRPLMDVLAEAGVTHIDYFSLDVEGGEIPILKSIDFERVTIDLFTIEDNFGRWFEHRDLLEPFGYQFIGSKETDGYFLHARLVDRIIDERGPDHLRRVAAKLNSPKPKPAAVSSATP